MLYLLDSNVLITAHNSYYPIDRVPEFWEWLIHLGLRSSVKIPIELYGEVTDGKDALATWAKDDGNRNATLLSEEVDRDLVSRVVEEGYASDLTDEEVERIGATPS